MSRVVRYEACLENYPDEFMNGFSYLLQNQKYVDVSLVCGNKLLKVHGIVLAARSEYFREIMPQSYSELTMTFDSHHLVIFTIVEFIYYGKTCFTEEYIKEIVSAAKFLGIKGLADIEFENFVDLPIFTPPYIIETKQMSNNASPLMKNITSMDSENKIDFVFKIQLELDGENSELLNDMTNLKNGCTANFKRGRGRPSKRNSSLLYSVTEKIDKEVIKSENAFKYLKRFQAYEIENQDLDMAIESISLSIDSHHESANLNRLYEEKDKWSCGDITGDISDDKYEYNLQNTNLSQSYIVPENFNNQYENTVEYEIIDDMSTDTSLLLIG